MYPPKPNVVASPYQCPHPVSVLAGMKIRPTKWVVAVQARAEDKHKNRRFPYSNWRHHRRFLVYPIIFDNQEDARSWMDKCFSFVNLNHRKMSASALTVKTLSHNVKGWDRYYVS